MLLLRKHKAADKAPEKSKGGPELKVSGESVAAGEIAGIAGDMHEPLSAWLGVQPNRDPLLSEQTPGSSYSYPYGLFEEALDKDAHLSAILAQRKSAVLGWEMRIVPANDSKAAGEVAQFVEEALAGITGGSGFEKDMGELLDAVAFGFSVSEVIWQQRDGKVLPDSLHARHPRRFVFGTDGGLRLLSQAEPVRGEGLPPFKFMVFAPYGRHENPYGYPQLRSVWWLAYFKRQVLKLWVMFCEKHGTPTAVLKYPAGATEKEKRAYKRVIASIQQETGMVVPQGVELELLEAQRSSSVNTYKDLAEFCNREMSKAILGQTLTTDVADSGSRALGEVHSKVREDIVRQDAKALSAALTRQLVRWIVDLNFPEAMRHYPRMVLTPPRDEDYAQQLEIDRFFAEQGLNLDEGELYERYGRHYKAKHEAKGGNVDASQ